MSIAATIREKLMIALRPTRLDVINESHVHAGHQSSPGTGESHFRVLVMSPEFAGKSRVDRHRLVNDTLAAELKGQVHALAIQAYAPGGRDALRATPMGIVTLQRLRLPKTSSVEESWRKCAGNH